MIQIRFGFSAATMGPHKEQSNAARPTRRGKVHLMGEEGLLVESRVLKGCFSGPNVHRSRGAVNDFLETLRCVDRGKKTAGERSEGSRRDSVGKSVTPASEAVRH